MPGGLQDFKGPCNVARGVQVPARGERRCAAALCLLVSALEGVICPGGAIPEIRVLVGGLHALSDVLNVAAQGSRFLYCDLRSAALSIDRCTATYV